MGLTKYMPGWTTNTTGPINNLHVYLVYVACKLEIDANLL